MFNNKLYFQADDGIHGFELWQTDGTTAGTILLKDVNINSGDSWPAYFTLFASHLYFKADGGIDGEQLWMTDGTTPGTQSLAPVGANSDALNCAAQLFAYKNALYFNADYDTYDCEVWKLDTTSATGITSITENKYHVSIYPNPGSGVFNLQINESDNTSIEIYNVIGEKVLVYRLQNSLSEFDLSNFNSGVYNIRVIKNNALVYRTKLIKI
jgi:ELWxxDGT repeat protein